MVSWFAQIHVKILRHTRSAILWHHPQLPRFLGSCYIEFPISHSGVTKPTQLCFGDLFSLFLFCLTKKVFPCFRSCVCCIHSELSILCIVQQRIPGLLAVNYRKPRMPGLANVGKINRVYNQNDGTQIWGCSKLQIVQETTDYWNLWRFF